MRGAPLCPLRAFFLPRALARAAPLKSAARRAPPPRAAPPRQKIQRAHLHAPALLPRLVSCPALAAARFVRFGARAGLARRARARVPLFFHAFHAKYPPRRTQRVIKDPCVIFARPESLIENLCVRLW